MVSVVEFRSRAVFSWFQTFEDVINSFNAIITAEIVDDVSRFEVAWRNSRHDGELPSGFHFEHYKDVDGPYRLCHIRAGPKRGYRSVVLFPNGELNAWWIYFYKKEAMKERKEMEKAYSCARLYWNSR
jgi:hypothetical protein